MRLVHLSDLHLGYRSYHRVTARGINQREFDVAGTFARAIDTTIAIAPELVVIGGDIFHMVRPSNTSIKHAFQQFARLRKALPTTEIALVAGNHDAPKTAETGSILGLFSALDIHVVDGPAQRLDFPALDLALLAVPDNGQARPELVPEGNRKHNVLLMHGEAVGISPKGSDAAKRELSADDMHAADWDYIALGHYHVYREIAPNCFYSSAIDYTTSDIWGERREELAKGIEGKGIVERDLESGAHTFHPLAPSREIHDLTPIEADGLSPDDVSDLIGQSIEGLEGGPDGKILRLKVRNVETSVGRQLDHAMLRDFRRRALHCQIELLRPDARVVSVGTPAVRRRMPLEEVVAEFFRERTLPADIDAGELAALARTYLDAAGEDRAVVRAEELQPQQAKEAA